jgi:ATP-dependent Clp protease ATP-binding subunit ClpC
VVIEEVRKHFRTEFVGRIDEMVVFRPLGEPEALRILAPLLEEIWAKLLEQHGVMLTVDPAAAAFIARSGCSAAHGVRELRRSLEKHLEAPLSNLILSGKIGKAKRGRSG